MFVMKIFAHNKIREIYLFWGREETHKTISFLSKRSFIEFLGNKTQGFCYLKFLDFLSLFISDYCISLSNMERNLYVLVSPFMFLL